MSSSSATPAWETPPVTAAARSRVREALGLPKVDRPTFAPTDIAWSPEVWLAKVRDGEVASLLESTAGPGEVSNWSVFASRPRFVISARDGHSTVIAPGDGAPPSSPEVEVLDVGLLDLGLLDVVDALTTTPNASSASSTPSEAGTPLAPDVPPFLGGLIGYLAYDAGHWFEALPHDATRDIDTPLATFAYYDRALVHHHPTGITYLVRVQPDIDADEWLASLRTDATNSADSSLRTVVDWASARWNVARDDYLAMVEKARDYIFAGDIFEVCLSRRFSMPFTGPSAGVYASLRERSPSPFAAFCGFADHAIISSSPERFLSYDGHRLETRPIKGTSRRLPDPDENDLALTALVADRKQRAEHLMIVDLSRSDLARVARPGSVAVPALFRAETYSHVNHLVSVIEGAPGRSLTFRQAMGAAFPGGSITGAPKVRSMEVIDELEPVGRGVYTGSIGYISVDGRFDLNIAIRTLVAIDGELHGQVGGAVVAASDPAAEWQETEDKAAGMLAALSDLA